MGIQLLFCVETNNTANTDWIYINKTIRHYYKLTPAVSLKRIPMDGKSNYRSASVRTKIEDYTSKYSRNGRTVVFYCIDTDNFDIDPVRKKEFETIQDYCQKNDHEFIWFCRDIEEVYWGERVKSNTKTQMAAKFNSSDQIERVLARDISSDIARKGRSNILCIMDKYLERL